VSRKSFVSRHSAILIRVFGDGDVRKHGARLVKESILLLRSVKDAYVAAKRAEFQGERSAAPAAAASAVKLTLAARSAIKKT
jgi:hypothetical protein